MSKRRNSRENWVTHCNTSSVKVHQNDNNNNSKKGGDRYVSWLIIVENILFSSSCMIHHFRCCINNDDLPAIILLIDIMSNFLFEFLSVLLWLILLGRDFDRVMQLLVQNPIGKIDLKKFNQQLLLMVSLHRHWLCTLDLSTPEDITKKNRISSLFDSYM